MTKKRVVLLILFVFLGTLILGSILARFTIKRIGVIEVEGVITDSKEILEQIEKFREDETIKGVVVRIESPGGASASCQEIHGELKKLREKKKVFVSMGSVCASGGYYIAVAGERIYAMPSTITGSIGVLMEQIVIEDLLKKIGLQTTTIKAGEFKDTGSPFRKMKEEEKIYLKGIIDAIHEQFIEDVAKGRNIPIDKAKKLGDGRIFTGKMAKEYGLVDEIGTFYDALEDLRVALNIKEKPEIVYAKKKISIFEWLLSTFFEEFIKKGLISGVG
ncbi:MAG: signal peptide peptidase SppA [Desulfobacterota bacterium]|nr:signal peptide peptidase SppA [Thermodesulfobacteriota bacterium]MDW8001929.1 signal peptide peptidase SppA [Deltaproteobacteria bacterium]